MPKSDVIDGQDIKRIATRKTWYDYDCVEAFVGDQVYLLPVTTIIQMVNEFNFETRKATKHTYLDTAIPKDDIVPSEAGKGYG